MPSTSERIEAASKRLASHSFAVDVLLTSLQKVQASPNTERYRKVNVAVLNKAVGQAPGATDLLCAVGYEYLYGHLVLQTYRDAPVAEAISALRSTRGSLAYQHSSEQAEERRRRALEEAAEREAARIRRARFGALVPKEPDLRQSEATSCTVVNIQDGAGERLASRRFDAEHTLRDLLNWVRSLERSPDGSIKLINATQGAIELDLVACLDRSLFSLDLWPVSHVRVVSVGAA